jgi:amino acid permease
VSYLSLVRKQLMDTKPSQCRGETKKKNTGEIALEGCLRVGFTTLIFYWEKMFHHEINLEGGGYNTPTKSTRSTDDCSVVSSSPSIAASPYWGESTAPKRAEGFSPFVAFCFAINYILGTGFLTVPWAFAQGGLVLSTLVIVCVGVFSDMAKNYLLETMARSEAMLDQRMHWIKRNQGDEEKGQLVYSPILMKEETSELLVAATAAQNGGGIHASYSAVSLPETPGASLPGTPGGSQPGTPTSGKFRGRQLLHRAAAKYMVKNRKFEVNTLCRVFLGKYGLHIYTGFICLYIYCTLWAYTSVFASAMAKAFPAIANGDMDASYLIYALIFAAMVVPMSCMELDEQVVVQVIMTGARFLMLGLMFATSSLCAQDLAKSGDTFVEAPMFRPSGIDKMLPIMVFAHIYHHSIPGLSHPVADKKKLGGIFQSTTVFSTIAYALIGLILASTFGSGIEQSSNLNWKGFTGGTAVYNLDGQIISVAFWAKAISLYVLCFPALDVISAFPLNAITLGNNMLGAFYGSKIHEVEVRELYIVNFLRLLVPILPQG